MTAPNLRQARRPLALRRALLPAILFALLPLAASAAPTNTVQSIKTVQTQVVQPRSASKRGAQAIALVTTYNVTLTSTDDFPMTDSLLTLNIGGKEFTCSSYGSAPNTLVFSLTRAEFQSLKTGDAMAVYYGQDNAAIPAAQWSFGKLDLSQLDKPAAPAKIVTKTITKTVTKK